MNDPTPRQCPNCGTEIGTDAPEALCPKCLIENAAWSQTVAIPGDAAAVPPMQPPAAVIPPTHEILPTGAVFGGYRILSVLGSGGMGAVYAAEQLESGRRVALKVLSQRLDSEAARKRFIREGRLAASINHPNSVYVFGTEEIMGNPTITMEIVSGGNLQEIIIRDGPMPVARAVDAILQIVSGLEAAQAIGILHRDVKPSNCFIDHHGVAKIGDFGLSISTDARGDSNITLQGVPLGTPAFSSPEQLRGEELHARSDLYSVGATLFYLLTGEVPFREANMIKLLSRVLEEAPPDPRSLRPEIPRNLARIILRCLAKAPSDRFKSYADLRAALQPYSSASPTPATLALRLGAYMIDSVAMSVVGIGIQALAWGNIGEVFNQSNFGTAKFLTLAVVMNCLMALYFGFSEGTYGASPGKRLLGLRLVGPNGQLAGFPRAFLRAGLLIGAIMSPYWLITMVDPDWITGERGPLLSILFSFSFYVLIGLMFCRARRSNGYAGLHGLATGTRVVRAPAVERRPQLILEVPSPGAAAPGSERIGPYHLIEPLGSSAAGEWSLAFDTKLLRRVWVRTAASGSPVVPPGQRSFNRPGRLRWITGRRSDGENWDAFEAPSGMPLSALTNGSQAWEAVRFWLLDLAEELAVAEGEGTTPMPLGLDRVWITADGHAKLLDFPAPGATTDGATYDSPATFLQAIADATVRSSKPPVPLHARELLAPAQPTSLESLLEALRLGISRPARISRRRRLFITLGVSAFPLIALFFAGVFMAVQQRVKQHNPDLLELSSATMMIQYSTKGGDREDLRRYVAHRFRKLVEDPATWSHWESNLIIDPHRQQLAKKALADYPSLTADEIVAADKAGQSAMKNKAGDLTNLPPFVPLLIFFVIFITYAAIPSLLMALIIRRGLILTMCGAVVVTANGRRASRLRALWRCLISWLPFLLGVALVAVLVPQLGAMAATAVLVAVILILTILSLLRRDRSLQDRLAGTWLVPK
ncbi:MAG: protein kinase [Akkermansiaceae bacterium]|nr:protein kinase [Akkermansiaceae bacterium]